MKQLFRIHELSAVPALPVQSLSTIDKCFHVDLPEVGAPHHTQGALPQYRCRQIPIKYTKQRVKISYLFDLLKLKLTFLQ